MEDSDAPADALAKAVEAAGGQVALAKVAGVTQGAIWQRLNKRKPVAAEWVLKVEAATGISRHELRPDIYPPETAPVYPARGIGAMEPAR